MAKVGRPKNTIPTIDWKCQVPVPIAAKVDVFLLDPVTLNPRYGARSALVTQLLIQWLASKGVNLNGDLSHAETSPGSAKEAPEAE
jgi:hypothetical protein